MCGVVYIHGTLKVQVLSSNEPRKSSVEIQSHLYMYVHDPNMRPVRMMICVYQSNQLCKEESSALLCGGY